jgi:hypothetical protein
LAHPHSQTDAGLNLTHSRDLARTAERGLLDMIFLADSPATGAEEAPASLSRNGKNAKFEPITLWAAQSQVTVHVGFVATSSTTYGGSLHYRTEIRLARLDFRRPGGLEPRHDQRRRLGEFQPNAASRRAVRRKPSPPDPPIIIS